MKKRRRLREVLRDQAIEHARIARRGLNHPLLTVLVGGGDQALISLAANASKPSVAHP